MKGKKRLSDKDIDKRGSGFREAQFVPKGLKCEVQERKCSLPTWRGRKLLQHGLDFRSLQDNEELLSGF